MRDIKDKGVKIVTNAGGLNPQGLADTLRRRTDEMGVKLTIAKGDGDDLRPRLDELHKRDIKEMFSGAPLSALRSIGKLAISRPALYPRIRKSNCRLSPGKGKSRPGLTALFYVVLVVPSNCDVPAIGNDRRPSHVSRGRRNEERHDICHLFH